MNKTFFVPDGANRNEAYKRCTHLAIGAHHDDIEIMAYGGIAKCFGQNDKWFGAVIVSDGAGSPRNGIYETCSDEDMKRIRKDEQKKAAIVGEYSFVEMLDYASGQIKDKSEFSVSENIQRIIESTSPDIIYTHNLADKHDTHIGVSLKVIKAIRNLPHSLRPKTLLGCEVWRGLDWMLDEDKVILDTDTHANLASSLLGVFDSQISGGKRYDLATLGRRIANATYTSSHETDTSQSLMYCMDLTPLIEDDNLSVSDYVGGYIDRFKNDVLSRIFGFYKY